MYIERESEMQAVCKGCNIEFDDQPCEPDDCYMRNKLLSVPAADVAPVAHGRWIPICAGKVVVCSVCGREFDNTCNYDILEDWNYCPNCGAKMDEKEGDNEQIN